MTRVMRYAGVCAAMAIVMGGFTSSIGAQMPPATPAPVPGIIPTGFGESVDRDIARIRAATERFKTADAAVAAGYPRHSECIANPPHGAMGFHFQNAALLDSTIDIERPEILVYEKLKDGTFKLNGVEYVVPISAWTRDEPPTVMGQKMKRAEKLGIFYLHVWVWEPSPPGVFADWNPRVTC